MDRLKVFQLYMAVKLHFTSPKYDLFEYRGRVSNISEEYLIKIPARLRLIEHLARRFDKPKELIEFLVSQYAYSSSAAAAVSTIYDSMSAEENYALWQRRKISMTQLIIDDFHEKDITILTNGEQPEILSLVAAGSINIESAVALQQIHPYIRKDYFIFPYIGSIIDKLGRWVRFDKVRVMKELHPHEN